MNRKKGKSSNRHFTEEETHISINIQRNVHSHHPPWSRQTTVKYCFISIQQAQVQNLRITSIRKDMVGVWIGVETLETILALSYNIENSHFLWPRNSTFKLMTHKLLHKLDNIMFKNIHRCTVHESKILGIIEWPSHISVNESQWYIHTMNE